MLFKLIKGFLNYSGALQAGDDLKVEAGITVANAEAWCASEPACEGFTYNSSNVHEVHKKVYFKTGITLNYDKAWSSYVKGSHAPPGANTQQVWVKRLGPADAKGGAPIAVLCVNAGPPNATADFIVPLKALGFPTGGVGGGGGGGGGGNVAGAAAGGDGKSGGGVNVWDIWKGSAAPPISAGESLVVTGVPGHSSRFFKLGP